MCGATWPSLCPRGEAFVGQGLPRGRGLFQTLELVADRASKSPFDPARRIHARLKLQAMANGLICYPMGGTLDGVIGDHVLLAPPYIISEAQLDELVDKLALSLDQVLAAQA